MKLSNYLNIVAFSAIVILALYTCTNRTVIEPIKATTSKSDSLQSVIDSLQTEIIFQNEGFDMKERRYEDVISEYEFGVEYLEKYHPEAYRDFHRIIGFKEHFRRSDVEDNKKRLSIKDL